MTEFGAGLPRREGGSRVGEGWEAEALHRRDQAAYLQFDDGLRRG